MKISTYRENAFNLFNEGKISEEVYDAMLMNELIFCDEYDYEDILPDTYAEIEYDDFDSYEAIEGARWDDMNYLHYMER